MKYLDNRILNASIPNHTLVPNEVLEKFLEDQARDKVLIKRATIALCVGGFAFGLAWIYFFITHKKMKKENGEIKNYFETMLPLVSNITAKLNHQTDGQSTTTDGKSEPAKVTAELNAQHEPNASSESRQPETGASKRDDLEDNSGK